MALMRRLSVSSPTVPSSEWWDSNEHFRKEIIKCSAVWEREGETRLKIPWLGLIKKIPVLDKEVLISSQLLCFIRVYWVVRFLGFF